MKLLVNKIISGGQTGADQGGLFAAKLLGIASGGTAPKDYITEVGTMPALGRVFNLAESHEVSYAKRTEQNIIDSDGTVIFSSNLSSPGTRCTIKNAEKHNKPHIIIDPLFFVEHEEFKTWLSDNKIKTLNVAGHRESKSTGLTFRSAMFILESLI